MVTQKSMIDLLLIAFILAVGLFWSNSLAAREIALNAVKSYCLKMDLQLLDEYVALTGLWPKRNAQGKIQAWRSYTFEFSSTGLERYNGKIILLGNMVESICLEPYRETDQDDSNF